MPPIDPSPHGKEILHQPPKKFPEPTPAQPSGGTAKDEPQAGSARREGKLDPADPRSLDESGVDRGPGERVPARP